MTTPLVLPLAALVNVDPARCGRKASHLARLVAAGMPVPDGFCILTDACRDHVQGLGEITAQAIEAKAVSPTLRAEVQRALEKLGPESLAVRSSSPAEDEAEASFAGQYATVLGVVGTDAVLDAIRHCWASAWSDRARTYRPMASHPPQMAVVVQRLVATDASGVAFTADPRNGRRDRIVVEATLGLGETLVSGQVTPDRWVWSLPLMRPIRIEIGNKTVRRVRRLDGTVAEEAVPPEQASRPALRRSVLRALVRTTAAVEDLFGRPQDVEWAVEGRRLWLLQARPVTALPEPPDAADWQVWTNGNAGEVLPDVVSPVTWSLMKLFIGRLFNDLFSRLGLDLNGAPLVGRVAGRAYFNVNTLRATFAAFPVLSDVDTSVTMGGLHRDLIPLDDELPPVRFRLWRALLYLPAFLGWILSWTPDRAYRMIARVKTGLRQAHTAPLAPLTDADLADRIDQMVRDTLDAPDVLSIVTAGTLYYLNFFTICRRWLDDQDAAIANRLLSGIGDMDSAEAALEMYRIAAAIRQDPALLERVRQATTLEPDFLPAPLLERWERFLLDHGHHARGEIELANPRWAERPDMLLPTLQHHLRTMGTADPVAIQEAAAAGRAALLPVCLARLPTPLHRALFRFFLERATHGMRVRENTKSELVNAMYLLRRHLLESGRRLAARGVLQSPDQIFFLEIPETVRLLRDGTRPDLSSRLAPLQAEYEVNQGRHPPAVVRGQWDGTTAVVRPMEINSCLKGLGVSAGRAVGLARVILRPDSDEQVLPGEILVAPFTDPGWTPYFLTAAAIVMDIGGLLSHGCIVAREYGIPAVVNVGHATTSIRTGQRLEVDGTAGTVTLLNSE